MIRIQNVRNPKYNCTVECIHSSAHGCFCRMAGNWLFSSRRWRNPCNPPDRAALIAGYDELVATFPVFSRCSRDSFLATISSFWSSWSRSTRHGLPDPPESTPAPTYDEWSPQLGYGTTGLGLESRAADLHAYWRGEYVTAVQHGRTDYPPHSEWVSGGGRFALGYCGRSSEPEVSLVNSDLNLSLFRNRLRSVPIAAYVMILSSYRYPFITFSCPGFEFLLPQIRVRVA